MSMPPASSGTAARLNWLPAGVPGAHNGIVSTGRLVIGVAGATSARGPILTAGVAGRVAGATSMALGEYVSVSGSRDSERSPAGEGAARDRREPPRGVRRAPPRGDRAVTPSPARKFAGNEALLAGVAWLVLWAVKLLEVRRGVERTRVYWAQPRGEPGGLLYVALGDSTAQGVGASRPELGYVGLLAEHLRADTGKPVEVINLSKSGARVDDVLTEQLPRLLTLQPDLVTIAVGANDIRTYDRAACVEHIGALTAALPAGTVIADVPYLMHGHWERDAREAAQTLTRSAREHGLRVVPLYEALRREGWAAMATQFAADLFHPNDRGYRIWADAFWTRIRQAPGGTDHGGTGG